MSIAQGAKVVAIILTRDVVKAKPFYTDVLGFPPIADDGFATVVDLNAIALRSGFEWGRVRIVTNAINLRRAGRKVSVHDGTTAGGVGGPLAPFLTLAGGVAYACGSKPQVLGNPAALSGGSPRAD